MVNEKVVKMIKIPLFVMFVVLEVISNRPIQS